MRPDGTLLSTKAVVLLVSLPESDDLIGEDKPGAIEHMTSRVISVGHERKNLIRHRVEDIRAIVNETVIPVAGNANEVGVVVAAIFDLDGGASEIIKLPTRRLQCKAEGCQSSANRLTSRTEMNRTDTDVRRDFELVHHGERVAVA